MLQFTYMAHAKTKKNTSGAKAQARRTHYLRHRIFYDIALVVLLAGTFFNMFWFMVSSPSFMLLGTIITHVDTQQKVVALTLDDGPLPDTTEETLDSLKQLGVKATFFTIGVESTRHPDQLKEIIAAGQEVGNHSYSHGLMMLLSYDGVSREVERNDTLIRNAGYTGPIPFRVPYNYKFFTLPYYLMQHNRPDISHDVSTSEGWNYSPQKIADDVTKKVKPGSIILLHPMYKHTISSRQAIPLIVKALQDKGYTFVTVSELLTYKKS